MISKESGTSKKSRVPGLLARRQHEISFEFLSKKPPAKPVTTSALSRDKQENIEDGFANETSRATDKDIRTLCPALARRFASNDVEKHRRGIHGMTRNRQAFHAGRHPFQI